MIDMQRENLDFMTFPRTRAFDLFVHMCRSVLRRKLHMS